MTFFTLLYHSGDDGAVVVPPPAPSGVSGPGRAGGKEPRDYRRMIAEKRNREQRINAFLNDRDRYIPPADGLSGEAKLLPDNPPSAIAAGYEEIATRIEMAARQALRNRMEAQLLQDEDEAIALLLLMN